MELSRKYMIDFHNLLTGKKKTIMLTHTKDESKKMLKTISKRFSFWWRKSVIYC